MYKFIQKNQKKFLAVFAVGLMIVFVLPTLPNESAGGRETAFHVGDEAVNRAEAQQAAQDFEALQRVFAGNYVRFLLGGPDGRVPPGVLESLGENREMSLLLQKEAQRLGLRAPDDEVDRNVRELAQLARLSPQAQIDPQSAARGVRGLLLIRGLLDRVASGIKPSQALVTRELARNGQRVKLDLVHYATEDFAKDVPAPTAEQLRKHFDEYKNKLPASPTEQNPFGFGYRVPDQVKLNYLTVPRDEVAKAVKKRKSDFDWRVEAMLHYRANPAQYPVTQPADTQPTSQPATAPTTASGPTTRPFEEVEGDIIDELIKPEVDRRADDIANAVAERMKADFEAVRRESAGAPENFGAPAYLRRVKDDVQQKHDVQLGVSEINEPKDEDGLGDLEGIGQSFLGNESFPQHVMRWAGRFVPAADKGGDDVLGINEPSRPFRDLDGNLYVFQIREATPGHPPADLNAVKDKAEADLRTRLAFDAATAAAKKLQAAAGADGLDAAAAAANKDVFTTSAFFDRQGMDAEMKPVGLLPGVELPDAARDRLVETGFELLERATPDKAHPREVVTLPAAGRVVVAELADVERLWEDADTEMLRQQVGRDIAAGRAERVLAEYFSPAAVKQRLGYRNPGDAPAETAAAD